MALPKVWEKITEVYEDCKQYVSDNFISKIGGVFKETFKLTFGESDSTVSIQSSDIGGICFSRNGTILKPSFGISSNYTDTTKEQGDWLDFGYRGNKGGYICFRSMNHLTTSGETQGGCVLLVTNNGNGTGAVYNFSPDGAIKVNDYFIRSYSGRLFAKGYFTVDPETTDSNEGGQIVLKSGKDSSVGINLDTTGGYFRVFGDGTVGTPLCYSPVDDRLTSGQNSSKIYPYYKGTIGNGWYYSDGTVYYKATCSTNSSATHTLTLPFAMTSIQVFCTVYGNSLSNTGDYTIRSDFSSTQVVSTSWKNGSAVGGITFGILVMGKVA